MRPLSRRDGVWIEIPELDVSPDVVLLQEVLGSVTVQAPVSHADQVILSDAVFSREIAPLLSDTVVSSIVIASDLLAPLLTNTVSVSDTTPTPVYLASTLENVIANETLSYFECANIVEYGVVSDVVLGALSVSGNKSDTAIFSEIQSAHFIGVDSDIVVAGDVIYSTHNPLVASDVVFTHDTSAAAITTKSSYSDTVAVSDTISFGAVSYYLDSLIASDSVGGSVSIYSPVLVDGVNVTDTYLGSVLGYAENIISTVCVTDSSTTTLSISTVISDTVNAKDILSDTVYQRIIVTNAETSAVSTYSRVPVITGLTEFNGKLYFTSTTGLYVMDADSDSDIPVVWTLQTGFSNLGSDLLKRVQDINVQGRTEHDITAQVNISNYGQKQEYHYLLPTLPRNSYRDGVIKVGQGLKSVYWSFGLQGEGPSEIDQLHVVIRPLSRRR